MNARRRLDSAAEVNSLVQRLARILSEIENLGQSEPGRSELELLANSPAEKPYSTDEEKARSLLGGLLRTKNIAKSAHLTVDSVGPGQSYVVPAVPGSFVINLSPMPGGGFHQEHVLRIPVVGWEIRGSTYAVPVIPGVGVCERWAVLDATGLVSMDQFSGLLGDYPVPLKAWIRGEIKWFESGMQGMPDTSSSVSPELFEFSGPAPRALWFMMCAEREWHGTLEELLHDLSRFRDDRLVAGWPSSPVALLEALERFSPMLSFVGLSVARTDNDRLQISRLSSEDIQGGICGVVQ